MDIKNIGIIAEYNPLHNGHTYLMRELRKKADSLTVIMSGSFVQRGDPALASKFTRAKWALQNGADMVLELPVYYALANAQCFAAGAVNTLLQTGIVDGLGFGAEADDINLIYKALKYKNALDTEYKALLKKHLNMGKAYPRAAYDALDDYGAPDEVKHILREPNSILALEYINAALSAEAEHFTPVLIKRMGAGHKSVDVSPGADGKLYASASLIREKLLNGEDISPLMPSDAALEIADMSFPDKTLLSALIMYAVRSSEYDELKMLLDVNEGLYDVLYSASRRCADMDELLSEMKSRRYTLARLKRILLCALLKIDEKSIKTLPQYIHVLGVRKEKIKLLSELSERAKLPVIISARDIKKLSEDALNAFKIELLASDVYAFITGARPGSDVRRKLLVV